MNYRYFYLLFLFIFISCQKRPVLEITSENFSQKELDICQTEPCSIVDLNYFKVTGDSKISEKINNDIEGLIIESLFLGEDDEPSASTIEEAATQFILGYRDHQADLPNDIDMGIYEAEIDILLSYQSEHLVSIQNNTYLFTGGAHGNGNSTFFNYDTTTGEQIDLENMITDFQTFEAMVEEHFRKEKNIATNASINSTGFWFEDDTFYVSNNVGFTENSLIVIYNTYEIAPYVEGPTEINIPLEKVEPFLNDNVL